MTFKEQAIADMEVFLNTSEFAQSSVIDGKTVACVFYGDEVPQQGDGIAALEYTLYVRAADFEKQPIVNQRLVIDGKPYTIIRVDLEQSGYLIRLRWYDS